MINSPKAKMQEFTIQNLCRWILSVKKNYRPVKYHNWRHALNVGQTMFTVLKTGKMDRFMNDLEVRTEKRYKTGDWSRAILDGIFTCVPNFVQGLTLSDNLTCMGACTAPNNNIIY